MDNIPADSLSSNKELKDLADGLKMTQDELSRVFEKNSIVLGRTLLTLVYRTFSKKKYFMEWENS